MGNIKQAEFYIKMSVFEAVLFLEEQTVLGLPSVYYKLKTEDKIVAIITFEKYFYRTKSKAGLVITIDNFHENTRVIAHTMAGANFLTSLGAEAAYLKKFKSLFIDKTI